MISRTNTEPISSSIQLYYEQESYKHTCVCVLTLKKIHFPLRRQFLNSVLLLGNI